MVLMVPDYVAIVVFLVVIKSLQKQQQNLLTTHPIPVVTNPQITVELTCSILIFQNTSRLSITNFHLPNQNPIGKQEICQTLVVHQQPIHHLPIPNIQTSKLLLLQQQEALLFR